MVGYFNILTDFEIERIIIVLYEIVESRSSTYLFGEKLILHGCVFKLTVPISDVLWHKNLIKTYSGLTEHYLLSPNFNVGNCNALWWSIDH